MIVHKFTLKLHINAFCKFVWCEVSVEKFMFFIPIGEKLQWATAQFQLSHTFSKGSIIKKTYTWAHILNKNVSVGLLEVYRSTCRVKLISQNLAEIMNKFLIFLKLNAWYTMNVLEAVEHSFYNISKQMALLM